MASKASCVAFLVSGLCHVLAAPIFNSTHYMRATPQPTSFCLRQENLNFDPPCQLQINNTDALLLIVLDTSPQALSTNFAISEGKQNLFSFSYITSPVSNPMIERTTTVTRIMEEATTVTVLDEPETITVTLSSSSVPPPAPSRSPPLDNDMGPAKAVWVAPGNMSDLSSFHVSKYGSGGKQNMKVVTGIPAEASATSKAAVAAAAAVAANPSLPQWDNASAALQLLFPEGSINPKNEPRGGAEFYATPIDISDARNVTLQYSVFFPKDFDWVLAGKLPGLYGGHTGCSGGNAALDCFSTRLMWRQNGAGELYLYAPKDKQTKDLCDDPQSVCDATYGLSVGRGSFSWTAGSWTTVKQTVYLNTPGMQDGGFSLDVNGVRVMNRNDVFYRGKLGPSGSGKGRKPTKTRTTHAPTKTTSKKHTKSTSTPSDDGGLLGPILSGILGGIIRRDVGESMAVSAIATSTVTQTCQREALVPKPIPSNPQPLPTTVGKTNDLFGIQSAEETEVKLVGIFFSTFFGGHEDRYATPRDQYVWFKDFALAYNE